MVIMLAPKIIASATNTAAIATRRMSPITHLKMHLMLCVSLTAFVATSLQAAPLWTHATPGDAPLCLAPIADVSGDGVDDLVVGFDSGQVICLSTAGKASPRVIWSKDTGGSVLAVLVIPDITGDGHAEVVVGNDRGQVLCFNGAGSAIDERLWVFKSTCNVSALLLVEDVDGDKFPEVAVGGASQRVYLRSGRTGSKLWTRFLDSKNGTSYISRLASADDINADGVADLMAWVWQGELIAIDGKNGKPIWQNKVDMGFTDAMASTGDIDDDGKTDFLVGGNQKTLRLCTGADGKVIWNASLDRPIRDALVAKDVFGQGFNGWFAATAGGTVACFDANYKAGSSPKWTANLGDVCRVLTSPGDLDGDEKTDVVACAENGAVVAFSGPTGTPIWRYQAPDVVRSICTVPDCDGDGINDIAVVSLDGTVALLSGKPKQKDADDIITAPIVEKQKQPAKTTTEKKPPRPAGPAKGVPIILYHDILPEANYIYGVSASKFKAQMDLLVKEGFTSVTLDQLADWLSGKIELPARSVCITFDGPYDGHHTWAFEILKECGLSGVCYITTDWIGTANHLDWHQLRELDATGVIAIENHTLNHPSLPQVDKAEAIEQLSGCNDAITRHMGGKISLHHAYPGGANNNDVRQILRDLGFSTATIVKSKDAEKTDDPMGLPRYPALNTITLEKFKSWIRPDKK